MQDTGENADALPRYSLCDSTILRPFFYLLLGVNMLSL